MSQVSESLVKRLEDAVSRLETLSTGKKSAQTNEKGEEIPASVVAYDEFLKVHAVPLCENTKALMDELKEAGELLEQGFKTVRSIILAGSKGKKPKTSGMKKLLAPLVEVLQKIETKRLDSKGTPAWNHFSALNEASKCLQWPGVRDITVKYVKETVGASQFYTNNILREYRTKDQKHVDWVKSLKLVITELSDYVKEYHMTGLRFNAKADKDAHEVLHELLEGKSAEPPKPKKAGGPPPPPPGGAPPPLPPKEDRGSASDSMGAVFDEIKQFKTGGLRKVTSDMKTKNRPKEERSSVVRAAPSKPAASSAPKKQKPQEKKPPKIELVADKKWEIANQEENEDIELEEEQLKMFHAVYIYNCNDSLIQIHGKVNSIFMDNCKKTSLVFKSSVAAVELVNCQSCKVQVKEKVPMISINKTDGAQVFLSKESAQCPIYSSKSSEMNLCVANDEDYEELPVPELFATRYDPKTKTLTTEPEEV